MRWPGARPGSSPLPPAGACEFNTMGAADGRNRDLFPLPTNYFASSSASPSSVCRAVRRRLSKTSYVNQWSNECAAGLNEVQSGHHTQNFTPSPSPAQVSCLDRIRSDVAALGPPPGDLDGRGALSELLAHHSYTQESATVAPIEVCKLSLPPPGHRPVPLATLLGDHAPVVLDRLRRKLLPKEVRESRQQATGARRPYVDPLFRRNPRAYAAFLQRCVDAGLIEFRVHAEQSVGPFAVWK